MSNRIVNKRGSGLNTFIFKVLCVRVLRVSVQEELVVMVGFREIGKTELLQELVFPDGKKGDDLS
jgi:AAA+ ATPase superfamily predicted ATPase